MTSRDDRAIQRKRVDELLRQIDAQRRQRLLVEAAGMHAPALEQETQRMRQQLAEVVSNW